ncbi:MAG: DNA translocase FtsK 4TM domain-containing protein [Lachnospiraceae bacterium]|nr:DNA translocase FtsK 4TM domain-containing protein [Lachnospiraceae bacterium]
MAQTKNSKGKKSSSGSSSKSTSKKTAGTRSGAKKSASASAAHNTSNHRQSSHTEMRPEIKRELIGWVVVFALLILTLGIYLKDGMGLLGRGMNSFFVGVFGFSAYVITAYSMIIACIYLFNKLTKRLWGRLMYGYAFMLLLDALLHMVNGQALTTVKLMYNGATYKTGGVVGGGIATALMKLVGNLGTMMILILAMILLLIALTRKSLVDLLRVFGIKTKNGTEKVVSFADDKITKAKLRAEEKAAYHREMLLEVDDDGQMMLPEGTSETGEPVNGVPGEMSDPAEIQEQPEDRRAFREGAQAGAAAGNMTARRSFLSRLKIGELLPLGKGRASRREMAEANGEVGCGQEGNGQGPVQGYVQGAPQRYWPGDEQATANGAFGEGIAGAGASFASGVYGSRTVQPAYDDTTFETKSLTEIAQQKGIESGEVEVPEEKDNPGAKKMISSIYAKEADIWFEVPLDYTKKVPADPQKVEEAKKRAREAGYPSITLPGANPPAGNINTPSFTPSGSAAYSDVNRAVGRRSLVDESKMLDIPLVANDVYLEKKRRYQERQRQAMEQENSENMIYEEERKAAEKAQAAASAYAGGENAYESRFAASSFASNSEAAADDAEGWNRFVKNEAPADAAAAEKDTLSADTAGTDQYSTGSQKSAEPVSSDLEAGRRNIGSVKINTDDYFGEEDFPEGYEERSETAKKIQKENDAKPVVKKPGPGGKYVFPPIDLLSRPKYETASRETRLAEEMEKKEMAEKLRKVLVEFGVEIEDEIHVNRGPSVTRFEVRPKTGVRVKRIADLADDIAMNLAAQTIRIEAPIPGKSAVGIEIPNKDRRMITLREVLEDDAFKKADSKVSFALGRDIDNTVRVGDVAKMPHMLIAGATGNGKSVFINALILSLLYKAKPDEVRMILVDPKVVELSVYNGIPHLMLPVVNDPKQASATLNWAVQEMTRRYKQFTETNVRDIKGYNSHVDSHPDEKREKMPQIVIIIDELADLMMVAGKEVETSICRLAQMARAAGMHLVVATQRPSVDVITGLIKANIPSRVAFGVSSGVDSKTILDGVGAEKLLGKGDMLFSPNGSNKPARIQGAFASDQEVENVVNFIKDHYGEVTYDLTVMTPSENGGSSENGGGKEGEISEDEQLFRKAVVKVIEKQKASISMLQREFRIGFNRAARLMDELEERGVVGEDLGSKPRQVLLTMDEWESMNR